VWRADDGDGGAVQPGQQGGGEVGAGNDGRAGETERGGAEADDLGVQQAEHGALVERQQFGMAAETDDVVGIRRDDIGEFLRPRAGEEVVGGLRQGDVGEVQAEQRDCRGRYGVHAYGVHVRPRVATCSLAARR
jgi:hypothetical protein